MSKLIEILPNVYGVKVPMQSYNFNFGGKTLFYELSPIEDIPYVELSIPFDFKILGTLTKDEISFDASEVVRSEEFPTYKYGGELHPEERFWDYKEEQFWLDNSDDSFRSALPEEIFFENEYGSEEPNLKDYFDEGFNLQFNQKHFIDVVLKEWQTAQENITEKLLILQKL